MGERRDAYRVLVEKMREKDHVGNLEVESMVIIKCAFKKRDEAWTGFIWLRMETDEGSCEYSRNETPVCIKR